MFEVRVTNDTGDSWVERFQTFQAAYEYAGEMFGIGYNVSSPEEIILSSYVRR